MVILRRIKEKLTRKKRPRTIKGFARKAGLTGIGREEKKEILGQQEMAIEKTKFATVEAPRVKRVIPQDLTVGYGRDKIVLQVRDPWWIHAYWEIQGRTFERLKNELQDDFYKAKHTLRIYDVSYIIFNGENAHRFFDIQINAHSNNWYIDTGGPGRSWCVDLGLLLPDGRFITIVRSNTVTTPIEGPSWILDEEWMIPEDMFARLYGMGFGLGRSSPVGRGWQERVKKELISSPGISSLVSPVKKIPREKEFWLTVNTELIVYGATEPDAKVYLQGKQINLRRDGTFTLRFALPDGKEVMPVKAISADNAEERTITPIVTKETK